MINKKWFYSLAVLLAGSLLFVSVSAQEYFDDEDEGETESITETEPEKKTEEKAEEKAEEKPEEKVEKKAEKKVVKKKKKNTPKQNAEYVGVEECKKCHEKEYEDFTKRKFSKAWKILEMRGEVDNPECLKCHATGYGKPTGFTSESATPHLMYKQCEACHGPGSLHKRKPFDKEIRADMRNYIRKNDVCIKCHVCMFTHKTGSF